MNSPHLTSNQQASMSWGQNGISTLNSSFSFTCPSLHGFGAYREALVPVITFTSCALPAIVQRGRGGTKTTRRRYPELTSSYCQQQFTQFKALQLIQVLGEGPLVLAACCTWIMDCPILKPLLAIGMSLLHCDP